MEEVPCSLAETRGEILEALFDNASRRQMTEAERKGEGQGEDEGPGSASMKKTLYPSCTDCTGKARSTGDGPTNSYARHRGPAERSSLPLHRAASVPPELVERHARELESIEASHSQGSGRQKQRRSPRRRPKKKKHRKRLRRTGRSWKGVEKKGQGRCWPNTRRTRTQITKEVKKEVEKEIGSCRRKRKRTKRR